MTRRFAHIAEENFAKILDHHNLEWYYEPTMFVLRRDSNGEVKRAFTPDFYVPSYDIYVEITVMAKPQRKRKKINMAMKLYPDIHIMLMNRQDMLDLEKKYKFLFC